MSSSFLVVINYFVLLFLNDREVIIPRPRRQIKRELRREDKAKIAAQLDKVTICCFCVLIYLLNCSSEVLMIVLILFLQAIENELMERLKTGIYPTDIYHISDRAFNKILNKEIELNQEVEEEEEEVLLYKPCNFGSPSNLYATSFY